ncbi:sensor histidine kinase [Tenacibaculum sp. 190524A02b]|uniref:histidine kinase n=1 Tax=Tenacibaculum vairaonense TaxID=3137860 RepID=A0ABM9PH85_9FLAO
MEQEGRVLIVTTVIIVLVVVFLVILFTVFQRRKNKLLLEREEIKKSFEKEIAETQIEIREETLRNISWELHDNIGQLLTLAKIQLQHATPESLEDITETIGKSLNEIRALSKLINPEFINNIKFVDALQLEIERFNRLNYIEASLKIVGEKREVNQKHGIIMFRVLQEFFSNTIKHSKATSLEVLLEFKDNKLNIKAKDNGVGFDVNKVSLNGIGLKNIKARIKLIKAEAELKSEEKKGTTLTINYYF